MSDRVTTYRRFPDGVTFDRTVAGVMACESCTFVWHSDDSWDFNPPCPSCGKLAEPLYALPGQYTTNAKWRP